jgi:hypothetical protein
MITENLSELDIHHSDYIHEIWNRNFFLNIATFNTRGYYNNLTFIDDLYSKFKLHALFLQETLSKGSMGQFHPMVNVPKEAGTGGQGLCVLVHDSIKHLTNTVMINKNYIILEIMGFTIVNLYLPHDNQAHQIINDIKNIIQDRNSTFILGDINCRFWRRRR